MSRLPSRVSTDSDPDIGQSTDSHRRHGARQLNNPRLTRALGSVDSGYPQDSRSYQDSLSPDAVPSNPQSLDSVNLASSEATSSNPDGQSQYGSSVDAVREHIVHRIQKAVEGKGKEFDKKGKEDSSSLSFPSLSSSSSCSSSMSSSVPSEDVEVVTDADIEELKKEMPTDMRVDFQDAMVLYCEDDRDKVDVFMDNFDGMKLYDRIAPKVILYDDVAVSIGSKIKALEFGIDRCTYVFLYITKLFCEDAWAEFSSETCLMEAIHNPEKKWCVVPVFTEPKRNASFRVPPSLNSLKGIQYWTNDKFFKESVRKLLEEKLFMRKKNEKVLLKKRKDWVVSHRIKKIREEVQEKEENIARQRQEQKAKEERKYNLEQLRKKEREDELKHQLELERINKESSENMQQMMFSFAQRFRLKPCPKSPGVNDPQPLPSSSSEGDLFQHLLRMSGMHNISNQQAYYNPANKPTGSMQEHVSLANRQSQGCGARSVQEGMSFQETSGPPASDEGSTGFSVPREFERAQSSGSKSFSLPSQSVPEGHSQGFQSLPTNYQFNPGLAGSGVRCRNSGDLEEDQPPASLSQQTHVPHQLQSEQRSKSFPQTLDSLNFPIRHSPVSDPEKEKNRDGKHDQFRTVDPKTGKTDVKEIHYHYHIYDNKKEKANIPPAEQQPINIVGAKIVQIGDGNLVKVMDEEFLQEKEGENLTGDTIDDESPKHDQGMEHQVPPRPGVSTPSQPPSTIYQDNQPSVSSRMSSHRPVELPSRPEAQIPLNPVLPGHQDAVRRKPTASQGPTAAAASKPLSRPDPCGQDSFVPPISSGPQAGTFSGSSERKRSVLPQQGMTGQSGSCQTDRPQVAMVKPIGPSVLQERGAGSEQTSQKEVETHPKQAVPTHEEVEQFEMVQTVPKEMVTESDPVMEQTLAKERALESEID